MSPARVLFGRRSECAVLDGMLAQVRGGSSGVLILRGEAGVGKTALLDYAIRSAVDLRVVRVAPVESEMELPFAGLHQMCRLLLDYLGGAPGPQRDALSVAFGLRAGPAPDHFLTGLALLSLLAEVAADQPLVCVIDDAQWLDPASAQALRIATQRLLDESVLVIAATRKPGGDTHGRSEVVVGGLPDADAQELLASAVQWPLDERVAEQIVAETRGNPRALLNLPAGLSPGQLAGGFGLPQALPVTGRLEQSFLRRMETLPDATRLLLVVTAADPSGDAALVWRAAARLGIAPSAAPPAAEAGLAQIGAQVRFQHPLIRTAIYRSAPLAQRQHVHGVLADVADPVADPDRHAWHRARAASAPDDDVAAELERTAGMAQHRGGLPAAAAFLERAAELTTEPARRTRLALAAATAMVRAGAFGGALSLLGMAAAGPLDELQRARADVVRARLAFASNRGSDAPPLLLVAARRLERIDIGLARATYLDTINAALFAGHLAGPDAGIREVSRAAAAAPPAQGPPRPPDLLLDGLAATFGEGYLAGLPLLRQALARYVRQMPAEDELRWLWLACIAALHLWDDSTWDLLSKRHVELARQVGALGELPLALSSRVYMLLFAGELTAAAALSEEVRAATEATGSNLAPYGALAVAATRGREAEASALTSATGQDVAQRGEGFGVTLTNWANAVLYNGLCWYDRAMAAAEQGSENPDELGLAAWSMVELVEAAARIGQPERAAASLRLLVETTSAAGTDWALGVQARSRALLADGDLAERLYLEAIERLGRSRIRLELARAYLVYGEWLRRENRRVDARAQLRTAHGMFGSMGADAFAERARRELLATGETVRKRALDTREELTAQEREVAWRARDGYSNSEIGAELFLSPRTVEWHLRKIFAKLGISSRRQLQGTLPDLGRVALPA